MQPKLTINPIINFPMVEAGDHLAELIVKSLAEQGLEISDGDILVVAQKIVSKSEGRMIQLDNVQVSQQAKVLGKDIDKDERLVELILQESGSVVRKAPGVLIVQHRLGFVCANAGIDQSNIDHTNGESALLLPLDPDDSAKRIRISLEQKSGKRIGLIISDSMNRPWRLGTMGVAIGSSGVCVLDDRRGQTDIYGRELKVTMTNQADSIAAAATLVMGETTERVPVALVQGLPPATSPQTAADCIRPASEDLFL
jgi:coenzyme F420-0:L-glutamate ligase/coenzyme F420-1:gamma-L-glutamate ligase